MRLSVIVPVYNVKPFLERCVASLLEQQLEDYEIILIDDGSTDGSGELMDSLARQHGDMIRCLHIDNGGQGRARNFGIDIARGDYLGFVDSDDWVRPDMYSKLLGRAEETGADVVVCDFLARYEDGREAYEPAALQQHWLASAGSSCNKIFRRSLVAELRFPAGLWYEDFYFSAVMLLRSGRTEFIREPLYIYRKGHESTMHNNNAARNLELLTIMDMLEKYMRSAGCEKELDFFTLNHVLLDSINRLARQDAPDKAEVIGKLRAYVHEKIPSLGASPCFRAETGNRRLIMRLNYMGLERLSQLILRVNGALKNR